MRVVKAHVDTTTPRSKQAERILFVGDQTSTGIGSDCISVLTAACRSKGWYCDTTQQLGSCSCNIPASCRQTDARSSIIHSRIPGSCVSVIINYSHGVFFMIPTTQSTKSLWPHVSTFVAIHPSSNSIPNLLRT